MTRPLDGITVAQMHMGQFGRGLAEAAARRGAQIYDHTQVQRLQRLRGHAHRVHTQRGTIDADQVLLATGATRLGAYSSFSFWRRRSVPIGSFIIVTEPLDPSALQALLPKRRTYTTTDTLHNYFRVGPIIAWCTTGGRDSPCPTRARTPRAATCCAGNWWRCSRSCRTCASIIAGAASWT